MIWWLLFFALNAATGVAIRFLVPVSHRRFYKATAIASTGYKIAYGCCWAIPAVALIQALLAPAESWPLSFRIAGILAMALGSALGVWAFRVNPWMSPMVARPPRLVIEGPYHWCRHPLYIGATLSAIGKLLLLGEPWAAIPASVYIGLLFQRIRVENKLLYGDSKCRSDFSRSSQA